MLLGSDSPTNQLELEIDKGLSGTLIYLNIFMLPSVPLADDETHTSIQLILDDGETLILYPYRLRGGQRLLFPPEATKLIVDLLSENRPFLIKSGRHELKVIPGNFENSYTRLKMIEAD